MEDSFDPAADSRSPRVASAPEPPSSANSDPAPGKAASHTADSPSATADRTGDALEERSDIHAAPASPSDAGDSGQPNRPAAGEEPALPLKTNPKSVIQGVFSNQEIQNVGTGTTKRRSIAKSYWFAAEGPHGTVQLQRLNASLVPSGTITEIQRDVFLRDFSTEPEFYLEKVYPRMRELEQTISRAESARKKGQVYSAEFEYGKALTIDEDNVRANFGLGLTYLDRGDTARADDIFQRLVQLDASFNEEHKHLFNEFGIKLRKNGLIEQSVEYYERAQRMAPLDENLFYNIARAYFEQGDSDRCLQNLTFCLEMNPRHEAALELQAYVVRLLERLGDDLGELEKTSDHAQDDSSA